MKRREFIGLAGGVAVAWPAAARAQQRKAVRRIGVLTGASGAVSQARLDTFLLALSQLGWTEGPNVQFIIRRGGGDADVISKHATELATLAPDVIMTIGGTATGRLIQATSAVPIVFTIVPDPVGSGFVASLSRPGGNATGFLQFEYNLSGKWLELLREIRPALRRVAVLRDSAVFAGVGQFAVVQSVAQSLGIEATAIDVRDAAEIERDIDGVCAIHRWRADRGVEHERHRSPQAYCFTRSSTQAARGLRSARVCQGWRFGLLFG